MAGYDSPLASPLGGDPVPTRWGERESSDADAALQGLNGNRLIRRVRLHVGAAPKHDEHDPQLGTLE